MFVVDICVCFVLSNFVLGLILWFWDYLWFDDLVCIVERRQMEVCFSPDVTCSGCLG